MSDQLKNNINVTILNAESVLYNKEAAALTSYNEEGKFDILPYHANFISIIKKSIIVHELNGTDKEFPLEVAVLKAYENTIQVYLGIENVDLVSDKKVTAS